ncbi:MAG: ferrous iron transporter B, partial [Pseudomonadales bacterium]|nr:ferrous iron transporter B [Pseudomonadales bacterium]
MSEYSIALIGNPNSGKTTLFNDLTGAHQRVGNWPGVTVEKKSGQFSLDDAYIQLVDLPGIYSLEQEYLGVDEQIARNFLQDGDIDLVVNIVDANNLQRNLVLTQQLLEGDTPVIVALNMIDVAEEHGFHVDAQELSKRLKVPVIPLVAATGEGIGPLKLCMAEQVINDIRLPAMQSSFSGSTSDKLVRRYHQAEVITNGVVQVTPVVHNLTETIDNWVLNRWLGVPFFLLMMYLIFTVAINVGAVFIDFFDILFGVVFVDMTRSLLESVGMPTVVVVLLADGLGGGIQLVATFIPVIGFLFLCLSLLEDSGYMSRAAFVVDRLMSKIG